MRKELRGICRRHSWLRACLCDSRNLHTPTTSVVSTKNPADQTTTNNTSFRRHHPVHSSSAVATTNTQNNSVGNNNGQTLIINNNNSSNSNNNNPMLAAAAGGGTAEFYSAVVTSSLSGAADVVVASCGNVCNTPTQLRQNNHMTQHHHAINPHSSFAKHSHTSSSSYSEQILLERPNNFSGHTSPSLSSSSPTSSSASELNASLARNQDANHSNYQNYLAFRAQQLNAAQIYASPPGTPLSQLYDTAGPSGPLTCLASNSSSASPHIESSTLCNDSRFINASSYHQNAPGSPHLYLQPQAFPRPTLYDASPVTNALAVDRSGISNVINPTCTPGKKKLHGVPKNSRSHCQSVPASPDDEEMYMQPTSHYPHGGGRNLQTMPHGHTLTNATLIYQRQQIPKSIAQSPFNSSSNHLIGHKPQKKSIAHFNDSQHIPNNYRRTAAS